MTEPPEYVEDEAFVAHYMYRGRASRRPAWRLAAGLAFGLLFIVGGVVIYVDLAAWEDAGQPERWFDDVAYGLYRFAGKLLVAGAIVAVGLFFVLASLRGYALDRATARRRSARP